MQISKSATAFLISFWAIYCIVFCFAFAFSLSFRQQKNKNENCFICFYAHFAWMNLRERTFTSDAHPFVCLDYFFFAFSLCIRYGRRSKAKRFCFSIFIFLLFWISYHFMALIFVHGQTRRPDSNRQLSESRVCVWLQFSVGFAFDAVDRNLQLQSASRCDVEWNAWTRSLMLKEQQQQHLRASNEKTSFPSLGFFLVFFAYYTRKAAAKSSRWPRWKETTVFHFFSFRLFMINFVHDHGHMKTAIFGRCFHIFFLCH